MFENIKVALVFTAVVFFRVPSALGLFTPLSAYQNPSIRLVQCKFKQQAMTVIAADVNAPTTKRLYKVDLSTMNSSPSTTLDSVMANITQF